VRTKNKMRLYLTWPCIQCYLWDLLKVKGKLRDRLRYENSKEIANTQESAE